MNLEQAQIKSQIIQSMAHPVRLCIVETLSEGDMNFSEICSLFSYDKSTISKHLSVLKSTGIIRSEKIGTGTRYSLEMCCFTAFLRCIDSVVQQNIDKQSCCLG